MTEQATEIVATASKEGRIGSITLARKGNNSLANDLGCDLVKALEELEADPEGQGHHHPQRLREVLLGGRRPDPAWGRWTVTTRRA